MKQLNKFSKGLKVAGVVLILVSLALWIYSLANTGGQWGALKAAVENAGGRTAAFDRIAFDRSYFDALSVAAGSRNRCGSLSLSERK